MDLESRIAWGRTMLLNWLVARDALPGDTRVRIEATIIRRDEWVQLFFRGLARGSGKSGRGGAGGVSGVRDVLMDTDQGRLLCDSVYWALHQSPTT